MRVTHILRTAQHFAATLIMSTLVQAAAAPDNVWLTANCASREKIPMMSKEQQAACYRWQLKHQEPTPALRLCEKDHHWTPGGCAPGAEPHDNGK